MIDDAKLQAAAACWDAQHSRQTATRSRWWHSPAVLRHINKRTCNEPLEGFGAGAIHQLRAHAKALPFKRGLSIGCGTGGKELKLLREGVVEFFDLYEISPRSLGIARERYAEAGALKRAAFHLQDFFATPVSQVYDLIHWDNSLHHMLDTEKAIIDTYAALVPGGVFYVNDYLGKNRFQHDPKMFQTVNAFRHSLPSGVFLVGDQRIGKEVASPSIEAMLHTDPTEAADSEAILPALQKHTHVVALTTLGGCMYHTGLNDIIANIPDDSPLLARALHIDDLLDKQGYYEYAFCLSVKP